MKALLAYNPKAGRFPPVLVAEQVGARLQRHGWQVEVTPTISGAHVTELAQGSAAAGLEVFIVAGGDGSVGAAAAGMAGSETALAVLPSGTTNVWAQELGLPKIKSPKREEVCAVADLIAQSQPRRMDVGACNGKPFLLWAGIGLDALVVRHSEQKRSHLKKRFAIPEYILRAFRAAAAWEGISATVRADCATGVSEFEGHFQLAVVSNIRLYAGGLAEISPEARLDDGEMDLWLFDGSGTYGALRSAWNILRRAHVNQPGVRRVPFRQVNLELASPAALHSDGEPSGDHQFVELTVTRQALKILVPPTAHAPRFENP